MELKTKALTDVGKKRKHNEDNFLENSSLQLYAVADGMGGHQAGEVASRMALDIVSGIIRQKMSGLKRYELSPSSKTKQRVFEVLDEAVNEASRKIYSIGEEQSAHRGMGTTLTAVLMLGNGAFIAHVGDSRAYLRRNGNVYLLSEDHTLLNEQLKRGLLSPEEAKNFPHKNVITRAVGVMANVPVDTFFIEVAANDRIMICSDGMHGYIDEHSELKPFLNQDSIDGIPQDLIDYANSMGGKDNITAVVVEVLSIDTPVSSVNVSTRIDVLQQVPLFEFLEYQDLMRFVDAGETVTVQPGSVLVREGEPGDRFFVILNGEVEITSKDIYITALGRGGHFGEMALIDDHPRSATVTVVKPTDLLAVRRSDFLSLLNTEPKIASKVLLNISRTLSSRLRETTEAFAQSRRKLLSL